MFIIKRKKYWVFPRKPEVINTKKVEYDDEPIEYCNTCLSLNLIQDNEDTPPYCGKCGTSQFKESSIEEWREIYSARYLKTPEEDNL